MPGSTLTWNPPPSGLRVLTLWLLIVIVLPLGLVLLPTPLFPLGVILIVVSLLEGGLPQVRPTPFPVLLSLGSLSTPRKWRFCSEWNVIALCLLCIFQGGEMCMNICVERAGKQ